MTSLADLVASFDFDTDPSPQDKISATQLDLQLGLVIAYANSLKAKLDLLLRSDDTLADGLVRLRNLHDEVTAVMASVAGWQAREACDCASTGNLTLSGEQTIDGVATNLSRALVKDQTDASQNGIYITGAGVWTRASDCDSAAELGYAFTAVTGGTLNGGTAWVVTAAGSAITLGTTDITWAQFGSAGTISIARGGTGVQSPKDWAAPMRLPVRVVATANVTVSSPGATIDSIALSAGDRVLLTAQSAGAENGPWVWNGASASMTRPNDYPTGSTVAAYLHALVVVYDGTVKQQTLWRCTTTGTITIGTTSTAWAQVAGLHGELDATFTWDPSSIASGSGLTSSDVSVAGAAFGDAVDVAAPYSLQGLTATAYVKSAGVVVVRLENQTGGAVDLASGTWRVRARKA